MPALGADMTEGMVTEWLARPGERVTRGDVIAVVDTDKSTIEVECFTTGVLTRILIPEGTRVPVGTPLALITEPAPADAGAPAPPSETPTPPPAPVPPQEPPVPHPPSGDGQRRYYSPLVRRLAEQYGVDLSALGADGSPVTAQDVERAAGVGEFTSEREGLPRPRITPYARRLAAELGVPPEAVAPAGPGLPVRATDVRRSVGARLRRPPPSPPGRPRPPGARPAPPRRDPRRAVAELMTHSWHQIPHYHLATTVDLAGALDWLHRRNRELPVSRRMLPAALLLKAAARAAREVPELNGHWIEDRFSPAPRVDLGVIVSLRGGGLLAPVIRDADRLPLDQLMEALRGVVERARRGRLRGSESAGASITVTNLGDNGVETVLGIIHPPQVALVGFGTIGERALAADGQVFAHPAVTASLAADHRASDGAIGARYLTRLAELLQHPEQL